MNFTLSKHTKDMLKERNIPEDWVWRTLKDPDWNIGADDNVHYFKGIAEHGGRILHAVVNPFLSPEKVVTVFFDRRARRSQ